MKNFFQTYKTGKVPPLNPPSPPFSKGETVSFSLYEREVGRDFQRAKVLMISLKVAKEMAS